MANYNRGENVATCKLSDLQVEEMRAARQRGVPGTELALQYRIHKDSVYRICNGRSRAQKT